MKKKKIIIMHQWIRITSLFLAAVMLGACASGNVDAGDSEVFSREESYGENASGEETSSESIVSSDPQQSGMISSVLIPLLPESSSSREEHSSVEEASSSPEEMFLGAEESLAILWNLYFPEEETADSIVHPGDTGEYVVLLQELLTEIGFDCKRTDGVYDTWTEKMVLSFQGVNDLPQDGIVDRPIWDLMRGYLSTSPISEELAAYEEDKLFRAVEPDPVPEEMLDNVFLDALEMVGFDITQMKERGILYMPHSYGYDLLRPNLYPQNKGIRGNIYYSRASYDPNACYYTDEDGMPDLKAMEEEGLVCASYIGYVYFNYLPNVLGIDTSAYTRPVFTGSAPSYYAVSCGGNDHGVWVQTWMDAGLAREIEFTLDETGTICCEEEIPLGSLLLFIAKYLPDVTNGTGSGQIPHVGLYAGSFNNGENNGKNTDFFTQVSGSGPSISTLQYVYGHEGPDASRLYKIIVPAFLDEIPAK